MAFKNYNANPFHKRSTDCTVRAIALLTDQSWDDIYIDLSVQGFFMKDMMNMNYVWGSYLEQLGYKKYVCNGSGDGVCYTIREFSELNQNGRYLVCTGSHVVAVVNGDYYDTWDSGDEIVEYYWRKEN